MEAAGLGLTPPGKSRRVQPVLRLHAQAAAHLSSTWYLPMFGIGLPEMIVIFAVALIVIGPDKLPELARSLAKGLFELKRTLNEMRGSFSEEEQAINSVRDDLRQTADDLRKKVMLDEPPPRQLPAPDAERLERARRSGPPPDAVAGQNAEPEILPPAAESMATAPPPQSSAEQSAPETTAPRS